MTILLLKGYNNYFNRIVKKESSITDYKTASTSYLEYGNVNFEPNDGIFTSLIVGGDTQKKTETVNGQEVEKILDFESGGSPDYLIVHNNVTISSRWFVVECVRVRAGQYQLSLKRDVLADFYDDIKNAPCFIEKGTIDDLNNYLLYNSENYAVNQIKTSENLIKDLSGVPWVVGYIARSLAAEPVEGNFGTIQLNSSGVASGSLTTINNNYTNFWLTDNSGQTVYAEGNSGDNKFNYTFDTYSKLLTYSINLPSLPNGTPVLRYSAVAPDDVSGDNYSVGISNTRAHLSDAPYDMFCIPFGEISLNTAGVTTDKAAALEIAFEMSKDLGSNLYDIQLLPYCPRQDLIGAGKIYEVLGTTSVDYNYIYSGSTIKSIIIWCTKSTDGFTAAAQNEMEVSRETDSVLKTKSITSTNARVITANDYSKVSITDDTIKNLGNVTVTGITVSKDSYNAASSGIRSFEYNEVTGYIMGEIYTQFPTGTSTGWNATITFTYNDYVNQKYLDYKISNECDLYRLVSPNYNGQFEWSIAKSTGSATFFNIDFTYKPFQPYIHVMPNFTKLYGQDFDDARGLICGGDFSLPITNDAWTEYQIQNKTYQEMFDRQIKNMDVKFSIASEKQTWATGTQAIEDVFNMADAVKSGYQNGGVAGALYNGIKQGTKTALNLQTGWLNSDWNARANAEAHSYAYDMFNYGLQNVQALPYSLSKVSAYNANNKLFPMVEYYTCSAREKQAFKDKLKYNGMSVNAIGKISDYVKSGELRFIKGQLIRLDSIADDSHVANEIYNEVNKGFYI